MWENLKKLVFVQEEQTSPAPTVPTPVVSNTPSLSYQDNNAVSPEIQEHFMNKMDKANLPGPDYYEFKKAINNSISTMPENILFQSTFTTLNTLGMTKDVLLKSIDEYNKVLDVDKVEFDKVIASNIATEVTSKEEQYKKNIEEINSLQQKVLELNQTNGKIQNDIMQAQNTINKNISGYTQGYNAMKQTLETDKTKINSYIQ